MERRKMIDEEDSFFTKMFIFYKIFLFYISDGKDSKFWRIYYVNSSYIFMYVSLALMTSGFFYFWHDLTITIFLTHQVTWMTTSTFMMTNYDLRQQECEFLIKEVPWSFDYKSDIMRNEQDKIYNNIEHKIHKYIYYIAVYGSAYIIINNTFSAYIDSITGDMLFLEFPIPILSFLTENWPGYLVIFTWELFVLILSATTIIVNFSFVLTVYCRLRAEFTLLHFALKNVNERIDEKQREIERKQNVVQDDLREKIGNYCIGQCVRHHNRILRYFDTAESIMKISYSINMMAGFVVCICTGIMIIMDDSSTKYKFIGLGLIQYWFFYFYCWIGESISQLADDVRYHAYDSDFFKLPIKCQKLLVAVICEAGRPLRITTYMGQYINAEFFMDLMKGSYSYINMLVQLNSSDGK